MKKKTRLLSIISTTLAGLALSLGVVSGVSKTDPSKVDALYTPSTTYNVSDTASELASYYSSINSQTGDTLLSALRSINSSKYHKNFSYSNFGTSSSTSPYVYTDYPIGTTTKDSNGQIRGSSIASFYTKTTADSFNKEHVWPNSKGGNKVENDILMPRPTISSENSSRGNSNFVEGMNSSSGGWDPYTAGYDKECRGECARIMLYCVVASSQLELVASNSGGSTSCGNMNTLIKWHFDYAPSEYEMNRNNGAEYLQGNRNPFVDHPEYVARIWSNFNSTISNLCTQNESKYSNWTAGNYCKYGENTPVDTSGVTISKNSDTLTVGGSTTISATSTNSSTISWTTSNSSIVSLSSSSSSSGSNITLTANGAGTATITAKATISGTQYTDTCTITVTKVVSSLSKGSTSPTKTVYTAGDHFDPTGLTITATYSDSTQGNVTSSVVWSPDPLTQGTTSVTGTYGGKSVVVSGITVNQATEPVLVTSNSALSNGDSVIIRTNESTPRGVTGCGSKDATVSTTQNQWVKYVVGSASSSGWTLYDSAEQQYIASPGTNECKYSSNGGTCYVDSEGHLMCSNRYLCINGTNYRFYTSIGSYTPFYVYKVPGSSTAKTLSSISVSSAPTKTVYTAGETFDPTGLVITRTYSDSTSDTYAYAGHTSEFTFNPTTSTALTTSNASVTITYGGKSCNQAITVNAAKTLSSISVSNAPTKVTYTAGETFDPTGLVIRRNYSDSTYDTYTYSGHTSEFTFLPSTSTALTTSNVSVSITYGGKSTSQAITVNAAAVKTLSSITISGYKTSFTLDEGFSFGGTVTANYSDSTSANVTSSATFSGYNTSTPGNQTVTVSYTYSGTTKTAQYQITVNASGGGGGESEDFSETYNYGNKGTAWSLTDCSDQSSYWLCPATGDTSIALIEGVFSGKTITSNVVITINSGTYGSGGNPSESTFKMYTSSACTSQVSATQTGELPTSKAYTDVIYTVSLANAPAFSDDLAIQITKPGKQIRLVSITVEFSYETSGAVSPTLSSISLNTDNVQKSFTVGAAFTYSGLVVTANYSDSSSEIISSGYTVSSPDMSSTGDKTVTVTYLTRSASYQITVNSQPVTSISATVSKTYYVGESISSSDITVEDNLGNEIEGFSFANDGYSFTYADAASGGALTNKTFTNSITYSTLSCSLTVQVQRKARSNELTSTEVVTYTDLPTSYQTSTTERTAASGIKFIAYNLANYSSKMQFKASGGYFQTTQSMELQSLTINNRESNVLTVYGSTNGTSFSQTISGTNDVYDLSGYNYVKVMRNGSGAAYCASLSITIGGSDNATNVANYIMYEDTENQCTFKLNVAIGYLQGLSSDNRNTFATSDDYVVSTARERLEAWALNQGKEINYTTGELVSKSNKVSYGLNDNDSSAAIIIVVASMSVVSLSVLLVIKKRRLHN